MNAIAAKGSTEAPEPGSARREPSWVTVALVTFLCLLLILGAWAATAAPWKMFLP